MEEKQKIIYFVTGNNNKFKEVSDMFLKENLKYTLKQSTIEPVEIQADKLKEIAIFKLNSVRDKIDESIFVEDAGFFVDTPLNGFPGPYSSYVHKTIGNEGIVRMIDDFPQTKAHFEAAIAFYYKPLDKSIIFEGIVKGKVAKKKRGTNGFGFDPIFIPNKNPDYTFAEISTVEKNRFSHRGEALKKLIKFLEENDL